MPTDDSRRIQGHNIGRGTAEYEEIANWRYSDDETFVSRLLKDDIPQRLQYKNGSLWAYRDRNNALVGFGSLDFCDEYARFVGGRPHQYIPLLAVNPSMRGQGFGKQILNHLVDQAALIWACSPQSCDLLFLDVYASNETAIGLYKRFEFAEISDERSPTRIKAATHTLSWLEGYPSHEIRPRRHLNESSVEKPARTFQQLSSIR